ncbi:MAG TPA: hypothetical protein VFA77_13920 [Candidatus Eisenbacteria bacterium]|nr:hypothetical protein [Candidatus Eisenbacteria bacterium]
MSNGPFSTIAAVVLLAAFAGTPCGAAPDPKEEPQLMSRSELASFQSRLLSATTKHLDSLIASNGKVVALKGKSSVSTTAFAFYLAFELTGNSNYRAAAVELADRVLADMKAAKFGVLYIKEKEKSTGENIAGGGPPAFGWYVSHLAYIYHKEGGREEDLKYIAGVLDKFPWNEEGWWSADIDVNTGISKQPLSKPSPINKTASVAMAAGMVSEYVKEIDPVLSERLKRKADRCIYKQIIPAQEADGFWHYGLTGNDPKNKDVLGYFMLTTTVLLQLQQFTHSYRDQAFNSALEKAGTFAFKSIAPITDPNRGSTPAPHTTASTPSHFSARDDSKRGFSLGAILFSRQDYTEGARIIDTAARYFPYGNAGEDGAHAVYPSTLILLRLHREMSQSVR